MGFNAVRFRLARSELNGSLNRTKGFCIPLQFHEDGAFIHIVGAMGRSTKNGSFKGIKGLCIVTGGREDLSYTIVGFCILGIKCKSMLKGGQSFLMTVEAIEGEALAVVGFCISWIQVNAEFKGISRLGECVKGFLVASELQERKTLLIVDGRGVWVEEQHMYIGFQGFLIPFHLVVRTALRKPLLFRLLREVRHTAIHAEIVTSVRHVIILLRSAAGRGQAIAPTMATQQSAKPLRP